MKLLILEDTPETMQWLQATVADVFPEDEIATATTLAEGIAIADELKAELDIAIVDLGLPDGSGIDLIKTIRNYSAQTHIVVATIYDDDKNLFSALRAGANGYILKDEDRDSISALLRGITESKTPFSEKSMGQVLDHFHRQGEAQKNINLTPREQDVLVLISRGYSASETAQTLEIRENTVKGYIKDIYAKLGISSRAEATAYAISHNLISSD